MGRKPNQWARVTEADEIVKALFEKHPTILWAVKPECIAVWGIENKERSEKNTTLAQIKPIKGVEKAIFQNSSIPTRYVISLYWSDWHEWSMNFKKAILFHELLHVHPDYEKTVKHDIEDFKIMVDALGVNWNVSGSDSDLPDLVNDDVKFNIALRPKVEDYDDEENDEIDGEEKKPKKRGRKPKVKVEDGEAGEEDSEKEKPKKVDVEVVEDGEDAIEEDEDEEGEKDGEEGENEDKTT